MKLTEEQAFKVVDKVLGWLGIEVDTELENGEIIKKENIADFVMLELINFEL